MKAAELRIGNYIQCKPLSIPRLNISTDGIMNVTGYGISVIESDTNDSMGFDAIPLTEEWLIKLGFETYFDGFDMSDKKLAIQCLDRRLVISLLHRRWIFNMHFQVKVKYVHEVQNLYFALTGKELL